MRQRVYSPYENKNNEKVEETTLRNLSETIEFHSALNTEIGRLLFDDLLLLLDQKFKLIYEGESTERDKAVFEACKYIGDRWNSIIQKHDKNLAAYKMVKDTHNQERILK